MKAKLGPTAGTTATAHKIAIIFYTILKNQVEYDATLWKKRDTLCEKRIEARLHKQAAQRGYKLVPLEAARPNSSDNQSFPYEFLGRLRFPEPLERSSAWRPWEWSSWWPRRWRLPARRKSVWAPTPRTVFENARDALTFKSWQAQEFQTRTGIQCKVRLLTQEVFAPDVSTALVRILQETLTNVARHAKATRVEVVTQKQWDRLVLRIRDNGRGFNQADPALLKSPGLLGMRERAAMLGGEVSISSAPGKGTSVTAWIALRPPEESGVRA